MNPFFRGCNIFCQEVPRAHDPGRAPGSAYFGILNRSRNPRRAVRIEFGDILR